MKKFYLVLIIPLCLLLSLKANSQCTSLNATFQTYESRCAATGAIKIFATGGSGNYKYKATGPVKTNYTTSDSITGLAAGIYTVTVTDIATNCTFTRTNVQVPGNYEDPRFTLNTIPVGCDNGSNGVIIVDNLQKGRSPFTFSIVAPSASGVGTSNTTGIFAGLLAGDYSIRLSDSCGGIQTRTVTLANYTWDIDSYSFTKYSCDSATGYLVVSDSRGNVSSITSIPGMSYAVVTSTGDTTWSTDGNFDFGVNGVSSIEAFAMDSCGTVKKINTSLFLTPSLGGSVNITNLVCSTFTASVTGITNFYDPFFELYDGAGVLIASDSSGVFNDLGFGSYCIKAHDNCTDTIISRCFTVDKPVATVDAQVGISDKTCNNFDAAITGEVNLTNPFYVLTNGVGQYLSGNTAGEFFNLPYGDYCITVIENCLDTSFMRCFSVHQPQPQIPDTIIPPYVDCEVFNLQLSPDSIYSPIYCLVDSNGNNIACNTTGIFDSIPLGQYCVTFYDACTDSTYERCFTVGPPGLINDLSVAFSNKTCSTFTATIVTNELDGEISSYCLVDTLGAQIACNSTGVFNNLPYAPYCIQAAVICPDSTILYCFETSPPVPVVDAGVSVSDKSCATFTATVTGQTNLTNPLYCIVDAALDTLSCNATGVFTGLNYGDYQVVIHNSCYDTVIVRTLFAGPDVFSFTATAARSCDYGYSEFTMNFSGNYPVYVKIFAPGDSLIYDDATSSTLTVDSIVELPLGELYKIIATDVCGNKDTVLLAAIAGYLNHSASVKQKCPGAGWVNGSGNIDAVVTSNTGAITVRVIEKDGATLSPYLQPDMVVDSIYTFQDQGPGSYVVRFNTNDGCNLYFYDTVVVNPYEYPDLNRSSAYQCDVNGFSVGAVVSNGVGPFTYEIIGSNPAAPSIVTTPQASPVFTINNGQNYSLIRLRALDACGNATLGDASVLPLANNGIRVTEDCMGVQATMTIDTIYNSVSNWYFKTTANATDSTLVATGTFYHIPLVTPADTGYYVCHLDVNNGCIERVYQFHMNGDCYKVLPVISVELHGRWIDESVQLHWEVKNDQQLKSMVVERKQGEQYIAIANISMQDYEFPGKYSFLDREAEAQNYYRIRMEMAGGKQVYSNVIYLDKEMQNRLMVYPNPAKDWVKISFGNADNHLYNVEVSNILHQKFGNFMYQNNLQNPLIIHRKPGMADGLYIIQLTDTRTGKMYIEKVIFHSK